LVGCVAKISEEWEEQNGHGDIVNLARNRRVFLGKGRREKKKQRIGKDGSLLGGSLPIGHFVLSAGYLAPAEARAGILYEDSSTLRACERS